MKKGLFVLIPIIVFAVYMSRPVDLLTYQDNQNPVVEIEDDKEEAREIEFLMNPTAPIQGEPVLIKILNLPSTTTVQMLKFSNQALQMFTEDRVSQALIGLDLRLPAKTYLLSATLSDGRVIEQSMVVRERKITTLPLGIPEKLGGNTTESERELVNSLVQEGKLINSIPSATTKLWQGDFRYPVDSPIVVTDTYGYSRKTVGSNISHKGTDFRAKVGTPVYAMNSGIVVYTGYLRNYGHVIVLDHGLGLQTIYMHLSEILAENGEMVERGDRIALSGDTGYVLGPHLHLSVKIDHVSIDPEQFMNILGER